ncbi:MAG TPA: SLC13 family permease [Methanomicrobiales archaeon]|nr:SLC13 family permease [Methanomicrobiales archaeon]
MLSVPAIPVIVLLVVFLGIAIRKVGRFSFRIWQVMLLGAIAVLMTGQISPLSALRAISLDVMLFLFGMFVVGVALNESGELLVLSNRICRRAGNTGRLLLLLVFSFGFLSALLMNDTLAIIGTPLCLYLARTNRVSPKLLLIALAFSITTGSVMSPIGNPQNLLVAVRGPVESPFVTFAHYLAVPTVLCLVLVYLFLRVAFRGEPWSAGIRLCHEEVKDARLALLSRVSLGILVTLIVVKVAGFFIGADTPVSLPAIALLATLPILALSERRVEVVKKVDWETLVFFAALFVLMESVWESGFLQSFIGLFGSGITTIPVILGLSVLVSQFVSNVPWVALYLPVITGTGRSTAALMALAAGSTIAGNLSILGAASNVIIIQNAEKEGETLTFWEFVKIGLPLTLVQVLVYWFFLGSRPI